MRILIADDDPVFRALLEEFLARWDHEVLCAADGQEAWEFMCADPLRLLILDWMMPRLDGFDLCRRIRDEGRFPHEPYIILVTGSQREDDIVQVLVAGADDYLMKPFHPSDLQMRLRAGLRILQLRDEVARLGEQAGLAAPWTSRLGA